MVKASSRKNIIISNIRVDGIGNGSGQQRANGDITTGENYYGIYLYITPNTTVNSVQAFNCRDGIEIDNSSNNLLTNSIAYNNYLGGSLSYYSMTNSIIENCQGFNTNGSAGISISKSS